MKKTILLLCMVAITGRAEITIDGDTKSPDGLYSIQAGKDAVTLNAAGGESLGTVIDRTADIQATVSALWSPNSQAVVTVEQYGKTADVLITTMYDKKCQTRMVNDEGKIAEFYKAQGIYDKVATEVVYAQKWLDDYRVVIATTATTRDGKVVIYRYMAGLDGKTGPCKVWE
ncbi:MAG: hypothetical protein IAE94_05325 [Chthoniobacterales bacterium]|nr:hypothetical protein [Chthoniobacterales bacterium]